MTTISAASVKELRDRTNMPMMACKQALTESNGDIDKAIEWLRTRNKGVAVNKAARETAEGRIVTFLDHEKKVGAIVEMRCESAPVAKSDQFVKLCNEVAAQVAYKGTTSAEELLAQPYVEDNAKTVKEHIGDLIGTLGENMKPHRCAAMKGLLGSYVHHDGTVGVLLKVEGAKAEHQLLRDVCMHVAAINPVSARREDVPAEVVKRETEIAKAQIANDPKNASKPANILEKIAEGKVSAWFGENVLEEQPFVKDPSKKVGELLKAHGLKLVTFIRYKVGEVSA